MFSNVIIINSQVFLLLEISELPGFHRGGKALHKPTVAYGKNAFKYLN